MNLYKVSDGSLIGYSGALDPATAIQMFLSKNKMPADAYTYIVAVMKDADVKEGSQTSKPAVAYAAKVFGDEPSASE